MKNQSKTVQKVWAVLALLIMASMVVSMFAYGV